MFEVQLILEIQKHPFLYNKREQLYRNKSQREKAWTQISNAVREPKQQCQSRWKSLRDRFVKEITKKNPSGSAGEESRKWQFLDIMMFLKDHIAARSTVANTDFSDDETSPKPPQTRLSPFLDLILDESKDRCSTTSSVAMIKDANISSSATPLSSKSKRRRVTADPEDKFGTCLDLMEKIMTTLTTLATTTTSNNEHFFKMLDSYMKELNEQQQGTLKIEILNFVYKRCQEIKST